MRIFALLACCTLAASCGLVHKIDVQQGNYVTQDAVDKVRNGMTKAEVKLALGTPLLADIFHANRWDYYFSSVKGGKAEDRKRLTIVFQNDKVVSITGNAQPPAPAPVGQAARAAPTPTPAPVPARK